MCKNLPTMSKQNIDKAFSILVKAGDDVKKTLKDKEEQPILLGIIAGLTKITNKLSFLTGSNVRQNEKVTYPPVTEFFGEKISLPKKVNKEDLTPKEAEKTTFRSKVQTLYKQFHTLDADGIINSHTIPEDQLVLRGVAKLAGVAEFEDRTIDHKFIADINKGIVAKAEDAKVQAQIDKELAGKDKAGEDGSKPKPADVKENIAPLPLAKKTNKK